MGINFPNAPTVGQLYPLPAVVGVPQYRWDGEKWTQSSLQAKAVIYADGSVPMTAGLTLVAPPVNPTDAAAKSYVDGLTGLASGVVHYDAAQALTAAQMAQAQANIAALRTTGRGELILSGGNLIFRGCGGNQLVINGQVQVIPVAGVSLPPTGFTPNLNYYIYAYMAGSTMTLEAVATTHVTSTTAGNAGTEIKSGDETRSLVGFARCVTGPAWADSLSQRFVLSWFNTRSRALTGNTDTSSTETNTTTFIEKVNSKIEWLNWEQEVLLGSVVGVITNSASAGACGVQPFIDGAGFANQMETNPSATNVRCPINCQFDRQMSEGYHYMTYGARAIGGGTFSAAYGVQDIATIFAKGYAS